MTRNVADFHGIQLQAINGGKGGHHEIRAIHPEHGVIGRLEWLSKNNNRPGHVTNVWVSAEHRRKGIATSMWRHAQQLHESGEFDSAPHHSENRTDKGDAFAKSVGGELPPRLSSSTGDGLEAEPFTPRPTGVKRQAPMIRESGI